MPHRVLDDPLRPSSVRTAVDGRAIGYPSRYYCGYMGLFYVGCRILNPVRSRSAVVRRLMVDTGAESTWIDAAVLEGIGIERRKKDLPFQLANQIVTRSVGYAVLTVNRSETVDEVVFAEAGDLQLLGPRTLEGLNLQVDARRKRIVAAGPIVSAAAVPPRFGRLVQVPHSAAFSAADAAVMCDLPAIPHRPSMGYTG